MSKIQNGDLVSVCNLPKSMEHFPKITGVVVKCNKSGSFFIAPLSKKCVGRILIDRATGWYDPEHVVMLQNNYAIFDNDGDYDLSENGVL